MDIYTLCKATMILKILMTSFEFGYGFGKELNSYFEIWLLALHLAKKQLE